MDDNKQVQEQQPAPNNPNNPNNPRQPKDPKKWGRIFSTLLYAIGIAVLIAWVFGDSKGGDSKKELSYTKFTVYVESNMVEKVVVYDDNSAKATIRPMHYALVFGDQEVGEASKGVI